MAKPDFFIVGAPRSGTTWLWSSLREHPQLFLPDPKEPHFFGSDLALTRGRTTREEYLRAFADAPLGTRAGEASVLYLCSERAAEEIAEFSRPEPPSAIVMLRHPVEMMYSMHAHHLFTREEEIADFGAALAAEPDRARGLRIPEHTLHVDSIRYRRLASFPDQIRRYFEHFGRESVHIVLYDDLAEAPDRVLHEALRFLDVDPSFRTSVGFRNENRRARSGTLTRLLDRVSSAGRGRGTDLLPHELELERHRRRGLSGHGGGWLGPVRRPARRAVRALREWDTLHEPRGAMEPALRQALQEEFSPQIEELSELIDRDLSRWLVSG